MVHKSYVPVDDNIHFSGQRRARSLKQLVKTGRKNRKFIAKHMPHHLKTLKGVEQKYKQFRHKECTKAKGGRTRHWVPKHTRKHPNKSGQTVKVKGYCRKNPK